MKKIIFVIAVSCFCSSGFLAGEQIDAELSEQIVYENGQKFVVRQINVNTDYREKYEDLEDAMKKVEQEYAEKIKQLHNRVKNDAKSYDKIEKLLGLRLWTQSSKENLEAIARDRARRVFPSKEMLLEYSFIFKEYPINGEGLKGSRRRYAILLIESGQISIGMDLKQITNVIGKPSAEMDIHSEKYMVYNMYPDEEHAMLLQISEGEVAKVYFGNRDGSNLKPVDFNLYAKD